MKKLLVVLATVVMAMGVTTGVALASDKSDLQADIDSASQVGAVQIGETTTGGEVDEANNTDDGEVMLDEVVAEGPDTTE